MNNVNRIVLAASVAALCVQGLLADARWPKDQRALDAARPSYTSKQTWVRNDVDDGVFVKVTFTNGFDVGQTCDKCDGVGPGRGRSKLSHVEIVPAAEYVWAKVVCSVKDDKKLEPTFTMRLTRYSDLAGYGGRAFAGVCDTTVDFRTAKKRDLGGGKWEVSFPVDMGDNVDLLFWDRWGTYLNAGISEGPWRQSKIDNYMDVDFISRPGTRRTPTGDPRMSPDRKHRSGIVVHGFTLERSPVVFEPRQFEPGNVFTLDDVRETEVKLTLAREGEYELSWTVTDDSGKVVGEETFSFAETTRKVVDLSAYGLGWYRLDYRLVEKAVKVEDVLKKTDRQLLTHHASFVVLDRDTRKEGIGEGPYGTWTYGGNHYAAKDIDFAGPLLLKAGMRRAEGVGRRNPEKRHAYKVSPNNLTWPWHKSEYELTNETEVVASIRKQLATDPNCRGFLMFHESAPWGYQMAPELTGQKWDPVLFGWRDGDKVDPEKDAKRNEKLFRNAMMKCSILRKNFPEVYISLGNSLGCTELVAQMIRKGLPQDYVDYMGLEPVVRNNLPERQWESSLQAADLMLQTAQAFGYNKWKVNACFESCYRLNDLIGEDRQAAWYVRDLLLGQTWRFPDVFIGVLIDTGNNYSDDFWGTSGLCRRMPYAYPKKAYAGIAVATRLLDQVRSVRQIPTGDNCVYAVEYACADGRCVTALWASQGEAELKLDLAWLKRVRFLDFYGRDEKASATVKAGLFPRYVVSDGPAVKGVRCLARSYPEDVVPADAVVVQKADNAADWRIEATTNAILEHMTGPFMPYRTRGQYALRQVKDEELGDCLELELVQPNEKLPKVVAEYAVVELKEPIKLAGNPASIGMMVKGNSGWGQVGWVVEQGGKRGISLGRGAGADVFDYQGDVSVAFSGWKFVRQIIDPNRSSIIDTTTGGNYIWNGNMFPYPGAKLVGIAFAAQNRPLHLTERQAMRQVIRFKDIMTFDAEQPKNMKKGK